MLILAAFCGLATGGPRIQAAETNLLAVGVAEFTAAYQAWDGTKFLRARDTFQQALATSPGTVTNYYWLGVAEFHRVLQAENSPGASTNKALAASALDAAIAALNQALKLDPKHAEAHAVLGTAYGLKIGDSLVRAAWFGPRVAKHRDQALALGPENPRVRYLLGMCQFHTASKPKEWRETLATLQQAEKLFESEAKHANASPAPSWGYSSCLTFAGRCQEQLGDFARAAEYYRRALREHPADHLAAAGLQRVAAKK